MSAPNRTPAGPKSNKPGASPAKGAAEQAYHQESTDLRMQDSRLLVRMWQYARPYRVALAVSLLVMMPLATGLSLVQPYLLQVAIDEHVRPGELSGLGLLTLAYLGAIVVRFAAEAGQFYLLQWVGLRTLADLRTALFRHINGLRLRFFHRNPVGRLMARLTTDIDSLQDAVSGGMVMILSDLVTIVAIVVILLVKDVPLALVTFACVPLLLGLSVLFRRLLRAAFQVIRVKTARLYAFLQEAVSGMAIIQLFNREARSAADFEAINRDHRDAQFRQIRWDSMLYAIVEGISSIAVALIIWYGSGAALRDAVTIGALVAFVDYAQKFFVPIRDLSQKYAMYQSAMAAAERVFDLFDTQDSLREGAVASAPLADEASADGHGARLRQRIAFEDVWFAYDAGQTPEGQEPTWVLRGVSFTVELGERVALVGHTGAGKSTIIHLLTRMYDPTRGRVTLDGRDLRECSPQVLRRLYGVVLQDSFLFAGDIRRNIDLNDPDVDAAAVERAARAVHVLEVAKRRRGGLSLAVAERGANLSAGEKQLISFARALARDPQVLILDEATANVDTETESLIQDAVRVLLEGRTSVVIAHRLSTIRSVDKILVLHKGELVESGSHEALLSADGLYAKLHRLQYELAA